MQITVIFNGLEEIAQLRNLLGIDDLNGKVGIVVESIDELVQSVNDMKTASDRIEAALDKAVTALDDLQQNGSLSAEDRAKVDQAMSVLRAEQGELNSAAQRAEDATSSGDGGTGGDTGGGGEEPGGGTQGAAKKVGKPKH